MACTWVFINKYNYLNDDFNLKFPVKFSLKIPVFVRSIRHTIFLKLVLHNCFHALRPQKIKLVEKNIFSSLYQLNLCCFFADVPVIKFIKHVDYTRLK